MINSTPVFSEGKIIDSTYVSEKDFLSIIFDSGQIFLYRNNEIEEAGSFPEGILEAKWSPNQENVLIATKLGKLIKFNNQFDPEQEIDIDDNDLTFEKEETDFSI